MRNKLDIFPRMNKDAWSHGQVTSKLWLCDKLEQLTIERRAWQSHNIWIYGGWYGMTAFLLFTRGKMEIKSIRSYDIEPQCEKIADIVNNNWVCDEWKFKAFTRDVNDNMFKFTDWPMVTAPTIIINTSCEHMMENKWFDHIPSGMIVALQSTDQEHNDNEEHDLTYSLAEMVDKYPLNTTWFKDEIKFEYPDKKFKRYMLIGIK